MIAEDDNFNTSFTDEVDKSIRKFEPANAIASREASVKQFSGTHGI